MTAVDDWTAWSAGREPWRRLTPEASQAFEGMTNAAWGSRDAVRLELARHRVAMLLRTPEGSGRRSPGAPEIDAERIAALALWPTSPLFDDIDRAALAITERFVIDVGGTTDAERLTLLEQLGHGALAFVQSLYALDMAERVELTTRSLFVGAGRGPDDGPGRASTGGPARAVTDLWGAIETFMRTVARLDGLDPVTTEIVRLAGARQHACRMCRSRRSVAAVADLGGQDLFDEVERGVTATLDHRQAAAVALTVAMTTQPSGLDADLVGAVRASFSPAQAVELVWDVARNGANKIAVLFGADRPTVDDGVEYFDIDADGDVVYEVDGPTV